MLCRCTCLLLALCAISCREQRQPEPSPIFSKESAPDDTVQLTGDAVTVFTGEVDV